ncbi:uncharacterized protein PITG_05974 [Phytophthora infestans T30-4]|uniref:Uncharacterized protein n=1 Tax=Phytophthora infestans (strain T30-4) TaxID=403677 RepID=D0N651_PHYIT|nr:uncharacterized protein PITG_05974 [Phytophthora infestans T30-4]EEY70542.1 hypothetical protein PITG_05974 [Phytophthora infestans T30-4]|eukprot:XP_002998196.1 hypothetical protein PITG_05974 [Phytophthora infestans T30-4]
MTAPPTASLGTGVADRDNPLTIGETEPRTPIAEPDAEPAPSITTASLKSGFQGKPEKGAGDVKRPRLLDHAPVLVSKSKAARSKEALMAFYLGRAKQMEAKHKEKVVSPTQLAFGEQNRAVRISILGHPGVKTQKSAIVEGSEWAPVELLHNLGSGAQTTGKPDNDRTVAVSQDWNKLVANKTRFLRKN